MLEHPRVRRGDERSQHRSDDLAMVERTERLADVVQEGTHDVLLVAPVAQRAGGGLEAVLETVDRVGLVGLQPGQEPAVPACASRDLFTDPR